jgi:ActR/RegA family two-component response regulator
MGIVTTVLILTGNQSFGEQLRAFVRDQLGCDVAGLASDTSTGLDLVQSARPDFALIDAELPDESGFTMATRITELHPDTRVVLMGVGEPDEYVQAASRAGALAYLPKTAISRRLPALMGITVTAPDSVITRLKRTASPRKLVLEGAVGGAALMGGLIINEPAAALVAASGIVLLSRWHSLRVPRWSRPAGSALAPAPMPQALATDRSYRADGVRGSPERRSGNVDSF